MKWQKARVVSNPEHPEDIGQVFWVNGRVKGYAEDFDKLIVSFRDYFTTNLFRGPRKIGYDAKFVELLPEFTEDARLVSWEEFVKTGSACG